MLIDSTSRCDSADWHSVISDTSNVSKKREVKPDARESMRPRKQPLLPNSACFFTEFQTNFNVQCDLRVHSSLSSTKTWRYMITWTHEHGDWGILQML